MTLKNRTLLVGLLLGGLIALVLGVVADSAEAVTVTVTTKDDRDDGACPSKPLAPILSRIPCTLRAAIAEVNSQPAGTGPHRINFAVGYGNQTINVLAYLGPLPAITRPVFIDGQSQQRYTKPCVPLVLQPGCGGGTLAACYVPCIAVNGMYAGSVDGLTLGVGSDGSTIRNLLINNFVNGAGIRVHSANVFIQGNYIGTDATGAFAQPSAYKMNTGVYLDKLSFNATVNAGNVISSNVNGIIIDATGLTDPYVMMAKRTNHDVLGNRIGTNAAGNAVIGEQQYGVLIKNASANVIGGGNLIGGNFYGVSIASSTSVYPTLENRVEFNFIGSDASGATVLGNGHDGVNLGGALTGGSVKSTNVQGNLVKYNAARGIRIVSNSKGNTVQYNTAVENNIDLTDDNADVPCANVWANNVFETHYDASETPGSYCIY